jgi:TRAP-type C4-dicarboxylate transport system permease small subunit
VVTDTGRAASISGKGRITFVDRADQFLDRLYDGMMLAACALLLMIVIAICGDVLLRNVMIPGMPRGVALANDFSETALYLITLLSAPWLLRQGRQIRVDFVLRAIPPRAAWLFELIADLIGFIACGIATWYGALVAWRSFSAGAVQVKTFVTPEWWYLAPLPVIFLLLMVEVLFRMRRLYAGPRRPRDDAVSSA